MPTTRRRIGRALAPQIRPEAIAAWRAGDYWQLHRELGLSVWQMPDWAEDPPGVDDRPARLRHDYPAPDVVLLKAALMKLAGPPPKRWRYRRSE